MYEAITNKIDTMVEKIEKLIDSLDRRGLISGIASLEIAIESLQQAKEDFEQDYQNSDTEED